MTRKILITGCSSGIGKETALHFKRLGWNVVATVRKEEDALALREQGITVLLCDIDSEEDVNNLFAHPELQAFDCAYLNAGYGYVAAVEDVKRQGLAQQFNSNVFGTWHCFTKCLEVYRRQGHGRLLVCSSVIGFAPLPYRGAYGASKAALEHMVSTARVEIDNPNIQLSLLNPGQITTLFRQAAGQMYNKYTKPDIEKSYHHANYLKQEVRLANLGKSFLTCTPQDVAKLIEKIFNKRRQKTNYLICKSTWAMWFIKRILPTTWFERFVRATYLLEQ